MTNKRTVLGNHYIPFQRNSRSEIQYRHCNCQSETYIPVTMIANTKCFPRQRQCVGLLGNRAQCGHSTGVSQTYHIDPSLQGKVWGSSLFYLQGVLTPSPTYKRLEGPTLSKCHTPRQYKGVITAATIIGKAWQPGWNSKPCIHLGTPSCLICSQTGMIR